MPVKTEQPARLGRARFHGPCDIGAFTYFNGQADVFHATIGRYCSIAPGVIIGPGEHPIDRLSTHPFAWGGGGRRFKGDKAYEAIRMPGGSVVKHQRTTIGSDVWIGARAYLAQGVTVGHGSVIAASAVVTHDVSAYAVVGGVPARTLRMRFERPMADRLLATAWWDLDLVQLGIQSFEFGEIEATVAKLEQAIAEDKTKPANFPMRDRSRHWIQRCLGL